MASADPAILLQRVEHSLDDVPLSVCRRSISRGALVWACASWFAVESQAASGRDHSTDAMLGIVAFVCQHPMAALASPTSFAGDADLIPECLSIRDVADLTRRQQKT